ncbi:NAD(+) synthase [Bellilinea sp.]|uniref:NAD(+) synthase n=1 Tax=Bellilinea sp. TaxID=2838785 RepID=UPI002ADE94F5|nr:NAD(+) synthase [Bellilinea sp.]
MTILKQPVFSKNILQIDAPQETERIANWIKTSVLNDLHRRGVVVGISGGIDSSVVAALCVRALGNQKVLGILLPESESSPESKQLALELAKTLGIETLTEDISDALRGAGCYQRRDEAIRRIVPQFGGAWKSKITLPGSLLDEQTLNVFYLTVVSPDGEEITKRIPTAEFLQIMAASNFKQRTRMAMLYYHAERKNYAVAGTANKNEHDLGFFVKYGDGGVDLSPILHLFKSQVYQLAKYLEIPSEIQQRPPTSDTYSAGSTQEEFFFRLPFEVLDLIWFGIEKGYSPAEIAAQLELSEEQVNRIALDIQQKKRTTEYLRRPPLQLTPSF